MNSLNKTITSLVTAPITQNIALIRVSGLETYHIISKIFDRPLPNYPQKNSQLIFGNLINQQKEIVDQVLLLCFYQPRSFTGEDVVEISCHGNLLIVNQILKLVLDLGAELAQPGEFTKQAFFNGKLNLLQANAINDLIRAPNISATKLALHNLEPQTQKELEKIEAEFLEIIAIIEVNIDYPEYDGVEYLTGQKVLINLSNFLQKLEEIFTLSKQAKVYQEGIKIAIVGKPNVGKSTLLNTLLQEEKAIVSPLAGTTRDIIEVRHSLNGIPLILFDTAGIREAKNQIEKIGVAKSQAILKKVDLVFFLCDNSRTWSQNDEEIWELVKNKKYLVIINKIDLKKRLILPNDIPTINTVFISAKEEKINQLETKITELFTSKLGKKISPYPFLSQSWQQSKLTVLIEKIKTIIQALQEKIPLDVISIDLQSVYRLLRELSGKDYQVDFLDVLFSKFCLGK